MEIDGVSIIFIAPPVLLVILAIAIGVWRLSSQGPKAAIVSVFRILIYGGFALLVLFFVWVWIYYSGGGH
jgi:hypothetical protein